MNILFTCGGTAGHVNPAVALARIFQERNPGCRVLFVGADGGMETRLVPKEGYEIRSVTITNFHRSFAPADIAHNLGTVRNMVRSKQQAARILDEFQPDLVVGTGGYASYPVVKEAARRHIPTAIHESNAVPGLTTKMLAGAVDRILVGFEESKQHYSEQEKVVVTGTPVRGAFTACSKAEAKRQLGLDPDRPLVVSVWGSLGASYMNEVMTAFITRAAVTDAPFALIHSAGRNGYEKMHAALLEKCPADLAAHGMDVRPYIYDMPLVMDAADLVLCRAGASTLAELSCIGKPAILIPSPNVTNNHQERNARVLEHAGGAKVLLEGAFTADDLYNLVSDLLADPAQLAQMAQNMKSAGVSDAAERIADLVLKLADRHAK